MSLLHVGKFSFKPLVPPVEWNMQLLDLLEQSLRVYLIDIFSFLLFSVDHLERQDCQLKILLLGVSP